MSDTTATLELRWAEAGADVPKRARGELDELKKSAQGAAATLDERLTRAFTQAETRAPTFAVRRLRFAMDELAASAIGVTGPWGRVIASFGMLSFGGAIAAVGGLVFEFKTLLDYSDQLDKQLEKLNDRFASLGGAGSASLAQARQIGATEPEQPGWALRLFARLGELGNPKAWLHLAPEAGGANIMGGDLAEAIETGMASEQATLANAQQLTIDQFHRQHQQAIKQHWSQLLRQTVTTENPEQAVRELLGRREQFTKLGAEMGQEWAKALLAAIREEEDPSKAFHDLLAVKGTFDRMGGEAAREWKKAWLAELQVPGATLSTDRGPINARTITGPFGATTLETRPYAFGGEGSAIVAAHKNLLAGVPDFLTAARKSLFTGGRVEGSEKPGEQADAREARNAEKIAGAIGHEIGPLIMLMAGAGGGARGAVAGLGGITGMLAGLEDPKSGKALLGHAAPWLTLTSGILSGVSALFGGHTKPKMIIDAYGAQAIEQMKELRGDPATTQFVVIGPVDGRAMMQTLNRLVRMGVLSRLPR